MNTITGLLTAGLLGVIITASVILYFTSFFYKGKEDEDKT